MAHTPLIPLDRQSAIGNQKPFGENQGKFDVRGEWIWILQPKPHFPSLSLPLLRGRCRNRLDRCRLDCSRCGARNGARYGACRCLLATLGGEGVGAVELFSDVR